ncbi:MAG: hypothetical protein LBG07_04280 [Treponema sp.]|nr:hypothetical protein [Treponema sp.]
MKFPVVLSGFLILLAGGCSRGEIDSIAREDLFSLEIGRMEDQLALYSLEGDKGLSRVGLTMREGLFYISDANGDKIVRYNSYGDLLFMIYNDESNPAPLSLKTGIDENATVTRWAFTYPLREPGRIAVDSRKHIYVEDRLPEDRYGYDAESKALLDSVVLHFDQDGRFVEYLGQGGIGGGPFSRITGLYTSVRDELVVVCREATGWTVHWYTASGEILSVLRLKNDAVPVLPDWPLGFVSVDSIIAAPDSRELYIKVDYYRNIYDDSTNTRIGTEPYGSLVWVMDVENGAYVEILEVPFLEQALVLNDRRETVRMLYTMMGVVRGGGVFFSFPVEEGYSLLILRRENRGEGSPAGAGGAGGSQAVTPSASLEQRRGLIRVEKEELYLNNFNLSGDGILSALLVSDFEARLVWWRTDKILSEGGA